MVLLTDLLAPTCRPVAIFSPLFLHLRAAEEEAAKAAAAEAKKVREAEKKLVKKQRQLLRAIAEGQGQQRLSDRSVATSTAAVHCD